MYFFLCRLFFVHFKNFFFVQTIFVDEPISVFSLIYLLVSVMIFCRMISLGIFPHTYRMYFKLIAWLKYLCQYCDFIFIKFHSVIFKNHVDMHFKQFFTSIIQDIYTHVHHTGLSIFFKGTSTSLFTDSTFSKKKS